MTATMQCVQFLGDSRVKAREIPVPEPGPGEALVRIAVSAICGSELPSLRHGMRTDQFYNPGHEMVGVVVKAHGLRQVKEGQRVGLQVLSGCGACVYCLQGDPKHCVNGATVLLNAHSEYVVAPEVCLVPLPDLDEGSPLDWESAVLLCGDTLGTPYHCLSRMGGVNAAQTAAVFGFGPIGMGFLTWLKFFGVRTIVSEIKPYRRQLAERLGADLVLDPQQEEIVARVREATGGGADICVDCSEAPQTLNDALDATRVFGRVGWVGEKPSATVNPSEQVIRKELRMTGSWYFTRADFYEQFEFLKRGLQVSELITHRFGLAEAPKAYALFETGDTGKVVFCHDVAP